MDWQAWHAGYADPSSALSRRLVVVQAALRQVVRPGCRVISLCAGDGRDLLPVLQELAPDATGVLVELDPVLAERARWSAPPGTVVVIGDAGTTTVLAGHAPADLVVACGVFGNVPDADVRRTVGALPTLLRDGGTVVWTRHRRAPDLTPQLRRWLDEAGFDEVSFTAPEPGGWSVGVHRLRVGRARPHEDVRMFAFDRD